MRARYSLNACWIRVAQNKENASARASLLRDIICICSRASNSSINFAMREILALRDSVPHSSIGTVSTKFDAERCCRIVGNVNLQIL